MERNAATVARPEPSFTGYLKCVQTYPLLNLEQEFDLARRWRDLEDEPAANQLVTSHLRLVPKIARTFRGYGLPLDDLIAAGNLGVLHAVRRFDPDRGVRLSTYATWWIRAAIGQYVLNSSSVVKMAATAAQKKLFFNLRRMKGQLGAFENCDLPPAQAGEIAHALDVPVSEVVLMNRRLAGPDLTLDGPLYDDGEESRLNRLEASDNDQEAAYGEREELAVRRCALDAALERLSAREREILQARRLAEPPVRLRVLAARYGISRERVRQIEIAAFNKVRAWVRSGWSADAELN